MKRLTWIAPLAFVVLMFGGVGIAELTGDWVTSGSASLGIGGGGSEGGAGSGAGGEGADGGGGGGGQVAAGELSPDDLRGWMTLQQAADGLGLTLTELVELIGPKDPDALSGDTAFREIETLVPGFSLTDFREKVRENLASR